VSATNKNYAPGVSRQKGDRKMCKKKPIRNYRVIEDGGRYTIGEWDEGYRAYIVNDGICQYYWWGSKKDAQKAADAYNVYDGNEWLGQHGYGNDKIYANEIDDMDPAMVDLYRLFNAVER
jgi:hypothetical protein